MSKRGPGDFGLPRKEAAPLDMTVEGSRERWTPACDETFTDEGEARAKVASLLRRALARAVRVGAMRTPRFRVVPVALAVACLGLQ